MPARAGSLFHVKLESQALFDAQPEPARALLLRFESLLRERAVPGGMIAKADSPWLLERHVVDSLRALACLGPDDREIADLGSGAGLPGIPVAIARPECRVLLVEPRSSRAAFLEWAIERLGLPNASVAVRHAADVIGPVDVCLARALADPRSTWTLANHLLGPEAAVIYFAGESWGVANERELAEMGVGAKICSKSHFPGAGPIVIMRRIRIDRPTGDPD